MRSLRGFEPLAQIEVENARSDVRGRRARPDLDHAGGRAADGAPWRRLDRESEFGVRLQPAKDSIAYSALKAGVVGLSRASAIELSAKKIRVNVIAPGHDRHAGFDCSSSIKRPSPRVRPKCLQGAFGEPEEIAALAAFLASDDASYIQGAVITADGGWTIPAR
jgi:NAD(P)-dependent dehydrogenase (short-subunit alcohol dehydrogenase family)